MFNRIKALALFFAIANMCACAGLGQEFAKKYSASLKTRNLDSAPKTTAILATEVDFNDPWSLSDITLAKINQKTGSIEKTIKVLPADTPKPKRSATSMILNKDFPPDITVFNGLEPGKYIIKNINMWGVNARGWYNPFVSFDIQEGQAKYIGMDITITHKPFQKTKMTHVLVDEPSREVDVWKKILVTYPNSTWQSIIQQKIDEFGKQ